MLFRSIIAIRENLGRLKVDVAKERIHSIDPETEVNAIALFYLPDTAGKIPFLVLALFCATAFLGVYYATRSLLFHQRVQKIKHEQHELERSIQPILEARATAASDVETIKAIAALNPAK